MIRPRRLSHALIASSIFLIPITAVITNPGTALARTCNTVATGDWSFNCTLQQGADSDMVVAIQLAATLESPPCFPNVNGTFDENTTDEVVCFQNAMGLSPDGIVGPLTWEALQDELFHVDTDGNWSYWSYTGFCDSTSCAAFRQWVPSGIWYVKFNTFEQMNENTDTQ